MTTPVTALFAVATLTVAAVVPLPAPEEPAWGQPVNGLRLGLYATRAGGTGTRLMVVVENVGDDDQVVNLGLMLANGKKQLPTAVRLTLTGGGKSRTLGLLVPAIAGRVDPFVVPLGAGCRYSVACDPGKFGGEDAAGVPPGQYRAFAEFVGEAVTEDGNGDSGPRLMSYWTGTIRSAEVRLSIPAPPKK